MTLAFDKKAIREETQQTKLENLFAPTKKSQVLNTRNNKTRE